MLGKNKINNKIHLEDKIIRRVITMLSYIFVVVSFRTINLTFERIIVYKVAEKKNQKSKTAQIMSNITIN